MRNYLPTILLLGGIVAGGAIGTLLPGAAEVMTPVGDIFMHLLFTLIVPMIFFSITTAIYDLSREHLVGRVLGTGMGIFAGLMLLSALIAYAGLCIYNPLEGMRLSDFAGTSDMQGASKQSWQQLLVDSLTVSNFGDLLSTEHILPLLIISVIIGLATAKSGEPGERFARCMRAGNTVVMKALDLIMQLAPIGLGCYFAGVAASEGEALVGGYLRITLLCCVLALVMMFVVFPLLSLPVLGWHRAGDYARALMRPTLVAVSSLSSSATMPTNIQALRNLGISDTIAESIVPLGTNLHKLGSVISSVLKVGFIMLLTGVDIHTGSAFAQLIGIGILSSIVVGAVPTGAGTGELLICAIMGVDPMWTALLIIVSTLVDVPGTLINVLGNTTAGILVNARCKN